MVFLTSLSNYFEFEQTLQETRETGCVCVMAYNFFSVIFPLKYEELIPLGQQNRQVKLKFTIAYTLVIKFHKIVSKHTLKYVNIKKM